VTNKPIEEIATEILAIWGQTKKMEDHNLF
jgi:regulator of PEP synthase PpsR (kinase-PPPase family)